MKINGPVIQCCKCTVLVPCACVEDVKLSSMPNYETEIYELSHAGICVMMMCIMMCAMCVTPGQVTGDR